MIWLPDGSVGQCGIVRAILLPRFGQSVVKWGLWGTGGGGGGVKSHTWTFLENYNSQALDKVNVPPPPPKKKKKKKKKKKRGGGAIIGSCV